MSLTASELPPPSVIDRDDFQSIFNGLKSLNYNVLGPTIRNGAVIYDSIDDIEDLPVGWIDRQDHGYYSLTRHKQRSLFAYVGGQYTWKKFLLPAESKILEAGREDGKLELRNLPDDNPKQAFVGVRACELQAIALLDKVLTEGSYIDDEYKRRREMSFILAVNCSRAGRNCFCVSMNTGPRVKSGYDLALTEVIEDDRHYFVIEAGSAKGVEFVGDLPHREAGQEEINAADQVIEHAASRMRRSINTDGLSDLLKGSFDDLHWEEVGRLCLSCGNCTMVCPTCFCTTMEDRTDLTGNVLQRWRKWDSCHTMDFSYIHGGSLRQSSMARYRQWLMHKLAYWPDQFGAFGCVGCGRCITWCPVGIDLTEEVEAIRKSEE